MYVHEVESGILGLFTHRQQIGYCEYCWYEKGIKVLMISVDKAYRRKGGATRFLLEIARKCEEQHKLYVYLDDVSNVPIYTHLGFTLVRPYDNEMISRASTLRRNCQEKLKPLC